MDGKKIPESRVIELGGLQHHSARTIRLGFQRSLIVGIDEFSCKVKLQTDGVEHEISMASYVPPVCRQF